ncbi:hypothetical protein AQ1_00765 [alpha proteobacterium Q-1]|nr:hypothetical protein AQ1_00765 [alpha proteobacterium Q-1]
MKFLSLILVASLFHLFAPADRSMAQNISAGDRLNLSIAMKIADHHGGLLWPDFEQTPKTTLLIAPDEQAVICVDDVPEGFARQMPDLGGCPLYQAKTPHNPYRIRAFTTFGRKPTIIIGSPYTANPFPLWIGIWLHEHFHQYQMTMTDYQKRAEALMLADEGDENGAWMSDFPFPYADQKVQKAFQLLSESLAAALAASDQARRLDLLHIHLDALEHFKNISGEKAARWAAFTAWQEGTANYFEMKILQLAAQEPGAIFAEAPSRPDTAEFKRSSDRQYNKMIASLKSADLGEQKSLAFYALGAGQSFLLDDLDADWHKDYRNRPFDLEPLLREALSKARS